MKCLDFSPEPLSREEVAMILSAGCEAPSPMNVQGRQFILVEDAKEKIAEICHNEPISKAPVLIIVCSNLEIFARRFGEKNAEKFANQEASAAVTMMISAADLLGIGHIWLGEFDENKIKSLLDIPQNSKVLGVLAIGKCGTKSPKDPKFKISEITFSEKYGNKITPHYDLFEWKGARYYLNKIKEKIKRKK